MVAGLLVLFGLLMLYSAGQTDVPTAAAGVWRRQLVWCGVGIVAMWVVLQRLAAGARVGGPALYAFSILLLASSLVVGTGAGTAASSNSWLAIGGHQIGQPSELAKLGHRADAGAVSLWPEEAPALAAGPGRPSAHRGRAVSAGAQAARSGQRHRVRGHLLRHAVLGRRAAPAAVPDGLPGDQPVAGVQYPGLERVDRCASCCSSSSGGRTCGIGDVPGCQRGHGRRRHAALEAGWRRTSRTGCSPSSIPRPIRVRPATTPSSRKVAIGSGGWFGTGYTEGPQKRLAFLPEQHTDFIFSVVGEELGFLGVVVALGLFLMLFLVLLRIARRATDPFSSLVVFGIVGLFFTHVFENVGMTVNLMPITGIPLPFFSYGGSFFVICSLCLGRGPEGGI